MQAVGVTQTELIPWLIESPADGPYDGLSQPYALTVTEVHTICRQGSASVQLLVDGEGLGPYVDVGPTPRNLAVSLSIPAGSSVGVRMANVAGCEKAAITYVCTRELSTS
ncbi:hypothetical protein [uncultured Paracoccus sp.]|uniref:hypothetical protein n=1 Tax=uncultured Paracoccus sp. TaxID=189685 RepID=UPI0026331AD5|nr:hypothetical protein [uncultured Paracoccus sp.]